ncbi:MAG: helix-hairpin-helix domain-containing protein [Prolixibacteraceae bacterium]|nr:helix-hairpin-helix domain-containing protein [Prolixibacteraceae bacterium]
MRRFILLGWLFLICAVGFAQESTVQRIIEEFLESKSDESLDDQDIQEILDDLEYFVQNPLKVNLEGKERFLQLHFLSEMQIDALLAYRNKTGMIYSVYELASVDGFSPELLQRLEPFLSFDSDKSVTRNKKSSGDILLRGTRNFSSESSASASKFEGSPERFYVRMKQSLAGFEYGMVAEKDPGEAFFSQSNKHGFDYFSGFVNAKLNNGGTRIFAGDYHVRFGQGLVISQGFSMGKSSETTQVFRSGEGIRSYSSTDENQFFRGLAGQFNFKKISVYPFVSFHKVDANVDNLNNQPYFGAFQTSGYHRSGSEISGENTVGQLAGGAHVSVAFGNWGFGLTSVYNRFNVPIDRDDAPYNQFLPEGQESLVSGINWKGSFRNLFVFGEAGVSRLNGKALVVGGLFKPVANAELSAVYRSINKTYFSYFANAFTESSKVNDEQAFYLGVKIFPAARWSIAGYVDLFRHQWIKYMTASPSSGTEWLAQVSYFPSRKTNFYIRFFQEEKAQKLVLEKLKYNETQKISRLRLHGSSALNDQITLKSRIEMSFYSRQSLERGFLVSQDIGYAPAGKPFSFNGRLAYFKTDGYNSRIYEYENDILYAFSIPALFGNGLRAYANLQWRVNNQFTLWLKFASTHQFADTGGDEPAPASSKSELKIQVRYQF